MTKFYINYYFLFINRLITWSNTSYNISLNIVYTEVGDLIFVIPILFFLNSFLANNNKFYYSCFILGVSPSVLTDIYSIICNWPKISDLKEKILIFNFWVVIVFASNWKMGSICLLNRKKLDIYI